MSKNNPSRTVQLLLHYNSSTYIPRVVLALALLVVCGCTKTHTFVIDAPGKYPSEMVIHNMKIEEFSTPQRRYGQTLKEAIASGVANEGYIKVVDSGPEVVVTGSLDIGKIANNSYTKTSDCPYYDKNTRKVTTRPCTAHYLNKKLTVSGNFQMRSIKSNQIITGDSKKYNFDQTWNADSSTEVTSKALSDEEIINSLLTQMARDIVYSVTPHKETIKKELKTGADRNLELGITYLKEGRPEQAISIWEQVIANTQKDSDKAAAYYNIGVLKETLREYKDAFEFYSKANALMPQEVSYIRAMTSAETASKQQRKLKGQGGI
jgi:hypothetical protein